MKLINRPINHLSDAEKFVLLFYGLDPRDHITEEKHAEYISFLNIKTGDQINLRWGKDGVV